MKEITISGYCDDVIEHTVKEADASVQVVAEEGSQATVSLVFEPCLPAGRPDGDADIALHIHLHPNAQITVLCLSTYAKASVDKQVASGQIHLKQTTKIEEGAHLRLHNITLGSRTTQSVESHLEGASAISDIDWIFYARDKDKHSINARNIFNARDGGGQITMKGVAEENAQVKCDGLIDIGKSGSGTDTYLTEDVLMLDKTAKVDAVPGLEIKTNDVSASHSATVSKVTPEDLFYFASRGISQTEAREMYVRGFLSDLTQNITNDTLRTEAVDAISQKFTR